MANVRNIETGRPPPHDLQAEAAALSACLIDEAQLDLLVDVIRPTDFYSEAHRWVFEAMLTLREDGRPIDVVQVGTWLRDRERIAQVGGLGYLTEILNAAPAIHNARAYAETVRGKARVRSTIVACQRYAAEGYTDYGDAQDFIDRAAGAITSIACSNEADTLERVAKPIQRAISAITEARATGKSTLGRETGFVTFDRMTGGLHDAELTVIAARPGVGKTAFVGTPARLIAGGGEHVAIFSLEIPREQLGIRLACTESEVEFTKFRTNTLNAEELRRLTKAGGTLAALPIWVDDRSGMGVMEIRAKARRVEAEARREGKRLGLVVVDYLQLLRRPHGAQSRDEEVGENARQLKELAKDLGVPVVLICSMNREVEKRASKADFQLSDLRESGAIEFHADNIGFLWRDGLRAKFVMKKQRNGPEFRIDLRYDGRFFKFTAVERTGQEEDDHGHY